MIPVRLVTRQLSSERMGMTLPPAKVISPRMSNCAAPGHEVRDTETAITLVPSLSGRLIS